MSQKRKTNGWRINPSTNTQSRWKDPGILVNWDVLARIARNIWHLHFMIFVESFDPTLASRVESLGEDKKEAEKSMKRALSQAMPPFPHKYSYRDVSSLSISLTYRCILSVWYMCCEKKLRDAHYRDKNLAMRILKIHSCFILFL